MFKNWGGGFIPILNKITAMFICYNCVLPQFAACDLFTGTFLAFA